MDRSGPVITWLGIDGEAYVSILIAAGLLGALNRRVVYSDIRRHRHGDRSRTPICRSMIHVDVQGQSAG